ncbi:MAG: hypothetical protein ACRCYR_20615 [Phycicoccus sp.]
MWWIVAIASVVIIASLVVARRRGGSGGVEGHAPYDEHSAAAHAVRSREQAGGGGS